MNIRILFLTTAVGHATFRKTARMIARSSREVSMLGFSRNNYPCGNDDIPTTTLGAVSHRNYFLRLVTFIRSVFIVRQTAQKYNVIYCFGLDALLLSYISLIFESPVRVYQVQDIRAQVIGRSFKARLLRSLESFLIKRVDVLVVSSRSYYECHFKRYYNFPEKSTFVLENKLESSPELNTPVLSRFDGAQSSIINVGYFGVLRCPTSLKVLTNVAKYGAGRFRVLLRGKIAVDDFEESNPNISFQGGYKAPDELPSMYGGMDLIWAAYPYGHNREGNWQWARTVRFYESCAYGIPVVVQAGTVDAEFVQKYDIGLVVDMADPKSVVARIQSISLDLLKMWRVNLAKLPKSHFVYQGEHEQLLEHVRAKLVKTPNTRSGI